jgi:hypothetical protein
MSSTSRRTLRFSFRSVAPRSQHAMREIRYATGGASTTIAQASGARTDFLFDRLIFIGILL